MLKNENDAVEIKKRLPQKRYLDRDELILECSI
jgi:hypothetical protein